MMIFTFDDLGPIPTWSCLCGRVLPRLGLQNPPVCRCGVYLMRPSTHTYKTALHSITNHGDDKQVGDFTHMSIWNRIRNRFSGANNVDPEELFLRLAGEAGPETLRFAQNLVVALDGVDGVIDGKMTIDKAIKRELVVKLVGALLSKVGITGIGGTIIRALVEKLVLSARVSEPKPVVRQTVSGSVFAVSPASTADLAAIGGGLNKPG